MTATINDYLRLSLTRCKALGYFVPNATAEGVVSWTRGDDVVGAVRFRTDTVNNRCYIAYRTADGKDETQKVWLRWRASNLNRGGYYYFVCPVTGRYCRNLYFVNGRFVSRFAFKALYEQQTLSNSRRNDIFRFLDYADKLEQLEQQPRRKLTYRGKPTPFARKVERLNRRGCLWYERLNDDGRNLKT